MKKIQFLILFLFTGMTLIAQNNVIDRYFTSYMDDDDFTVVSISGKMLDMISKDEGDNENDDIISSLKSINILTTEKAPTDFYNLAKSKLYDNKYEELMKVKDKDSNVLFMVKGSDGKKVNELVLLIGEKDSTVLMSFTGDIMLDKISKLGKSLNIEGADNLEKLDEK